MTYTSVNFIFFVLATMLVYFLFPKRNYRWTVLLAASVFFYLVTGYTYAVFILFTALSTFLIGLWIDKISRNSKIYLRDNKKSLSREEKKKYKNKIKIQKRWVMTLALVLNFGILAFLKYYNFFAGSLNDILGSFGMDFSAPTLKLFLPLGISFYTFQSMGYIIDVYRETTPPERNPFKMLLFVSFFPQIIQGPISLHGQLAHQLYEGHEFEFTRFKYGAELIIWGFIKKLIIADRSAILITAVTDNYGSYNGSSLTFTVLLYALQLYADFSGGIDISRGVAQIFGIDMIDNFRRPYFSRSISEYWRRWHISLGAWLKNYLFYPVAMSNFFITAGKNMKKTGRIYYTQVATTPEGEPVMMGTFLVANHPAVILFDSGASHTFISKKFVEKYCIPFIESREGFVIHSPGGQIITKEVVELWPRRGSLVHPCSYSS